MMVRELIEQLRLFHPDAIVRLDHSSQSDEQHEIAYVETRGSYGCTIVGQP